MENCLNETIRVVQLQSHDEVLQRWRAMCGLVKNRKRRFRFTANFQKNQNEAAIKDICAIVTIDIGNFHLPQIPIFLSETNLVIFQIPLSEIKRATDNFSSPIGIGGFGKVYKGQLSERWENLTVAVKCLSQNSGQGEYEFRNELKMISCLNHENIIPFIGYCDEGDQMIIVYKYAVNGSLDRYLKDKKKMSSLTWAQRLNICIGAARGIRYLHSGIGPQNRVIHRDIKSGNILLDDNMEAKISDFGLSRLGPRNQAHSQVYTKAAGTFCYLDPIYQECDILRKESDVYSYGVVLFELLSGMLAYNGRDIEDGSPQQLMNQVRRYELEKLIDPCIKDQIDTAHPSFQAFKEVAYQCVSFNLKERPTMERIVETMEEAYRYSSR